MKTLKDFENRIDQRGSVEKTLVYELLEELRAEAVKWAKYYKFQKEGTLYGDGFREYKGKFEATMNFFNLKDEDIKSDKEIAKEIVANALKMARISQKEQKEKRNG